MMIASKDVDVDDRVKAVMEAELSEKNEDPSQKGEHHVVMINHEWSSRWLERTSLTKFHMALVGKASLAVEG